VEEMSTMDWNRLAPHRPLGPGDALHVERPADGGERLAALVRARMGPIAVTGPVGCGKSTELAAAAKALESDFVTRIVPVDRLADMRKLDEQGLLELVNKALASDRSGAAALGVAAEPRNEFLSLVRQLAQKSPQGRVVLLLDGLEKCPAESASRVVQALLSIREEADFVAVVPLDLVTGPGGYALISEMRLFHVRPVPVLQEQGVQWREGRRFMREIFLRRMGLTTAEEAQEQLLAHATDSSSGLPRTFLQLMRDAGGYAAIAGRDVPGLEDFQDALLDHRESLQRLLRDGDTEVLRRADGTDGLEVPIERRVRLLTHGLLLENEVAGRVVVHMNQILRTEGGLYK
jgi:hypothetical protein